MELKTITFEAFCRRFETEEACVEALYEARWPNGFRCPDCGRERHYRISTRRLPLFECVACHRQTSVIAGTIMASSSTSLTTWFQALYLLAQPDGTSSLQLSRVLGVTYKTAWLMSHKIRHAMQTSDQDEQLSGRVHVEQSFYGSILYPDARHPLLFAEAPQTAADHSPTIKIKQPAPDHVDNEHRRILKSGLDAFISEHTDGRQVDIYSPYDSRGRKLHDVKKQVNDWLNDVFNGIGAKHLQAYLDEFCFRLNTLMRGASIFGRLLNWCAVSSPLILRRLTRDRPILPVPWRATGNRSRWRYGHIRTWED